jgi:hypothetical protein
MVDITENLTGLLGLESLKQEKDREENEKKAVLENKKLAQLLSYPYLLKTYLGFLKL